MNRLRFLSRPLQLVAAITQNQVSRVWRARIATRWLTAVIATTILPWAKAADYTWNLSTSGNWDTSSANWTGAGTTWVNGSSNTATFGGTATSVSATQGITANSLIFDTSGYTISTSNNSTLTLAGTGAGMVTDFSAAASVSINISLAGSDGFTKSGGANGGGRVVLNRVSTYTGTTTITAGTLQVATGADRLPITTDLAISSAGTFNIAASAGSQQIAGLTGSGIVTTTGNVTFTLSGATGGATFTGAVNSGISLTKTGTGTQTLGGSGSSSYSGGTFIGGGTLIAAKASAFGTGSVSVFSTGGTWGLQGNITQTNSATVAGTGASGTAGAIDNLSGSNALSGALLLSGSTSIGTTAGNLTISGGIDSDANVLTFTPAGGTQITVSTAAISGTGTVVKNGAGTVNLSANNTYTGATIISAGTLLINGSIASGNNIQVSSGATLGGSGSINKAAIVANGGRLTPGDTTGVLSFGAGLTLQPSALTNFEIGGTTRGTQYDGINVTGAMTYGGTLTLDFSSALSGSGSLTLFQLGTAPTGSFSAVTGTGQHAGSFTFDSGTSKWTMTSGAVVLSFTPSTGALAYSPSAPAPVVSGVTPNAGPLAGGTSVTITGTDFTGVSAVTFGATAATSFTFNSATQITAVAPAGTAGTVDVQVTTPGGTSATSASAKYSHVAAPVITADPQSIIAAGAQSTTLTVSATGTGPLSYQWYFNNDPLPGQNLATLTLPYVLLKDVGPYKVTVTNSGGTVTSNPATVSSGPYVVNHSTSFSVGVGGRARFFVTAETTGNLTYQWRKNGDLIAQATSSTYEISVVTVADAGDYDCVVGHNYSILKAMSTAATLTVVANPSVYAATTQIVDDKGVTAYVAITGTGSKKVILAAYGPALSDGAAVSDPQIFVENASGTAVTSNNDWGTIVDGGFSADYTRSGLRALSSGSKDAVVYTTLAAGSYRIRITGVGGAAGKVALAIADLDNNPATRVAYVGVLAPVSSSTPLMGGFTVVNSSTRKLLTRAVGPGLGASGLADPLLKLFDSDGTTVAKENDNWGGGTPLKSAFTQAGMFALDDASKDAAVSDTIFIGKGSYTAQVSTTTGSGTVLWEIADLDGSTPSAVDPIVLVGPSNQSVASGGTATLSALALGGGTLSYQWRNNGDNIPSANGSTYTASANGSYDVVVTSSTSSSTATSSAAAVAYAPTIGTHPQTQTIAGLGSGTLTVSATGTGPLTYQWKFNGDPIGGATGASFTLPFALKKDAGAYTVTVTNGAGSTTSNPANITVGPYVLNTTTNLSVGVGGRARFFVTADGSGTLTYQWRKNGDPIALATSSTYEISAVTVADAGSYDVVVSHTTSSEKAMATAAVLTVVANPAVYVASTQIADAHGVTAYLAIEGTGSKKVILAAYGPALSDGAAISDPQIVVENASGTNVTSNNDWGTIVDSNFSADYTRSGLRPLTGGSKDAVVYTTLTAGSYRIRITGVAGATGKVGLAIADLDNNPATRIAYLGVRGPVSPTSPLTGGFTVLSSASKKLLVRAVSSSLGGAGLADPVLSLYDTNGTTVAASNDNWGGGNALKTVFTQAGTSTLDDASKDAAVSDSLLIGKGSYTAQITSTAGSGDVLWEIADLQGSTATTIAPIVVIGPTSQTVTGGNITLSASAIGGGTLSYQWRKGGDNIPSANGPTLTLPSVTPASSGLYDVVVSTTLGSATATSDAANLQVAPTVNAATGPLASSYKASAVLTFELTFNGNITVTGAPRLALTIGSATAYAAYNAGASTATKLVFSYTIQAGDADSDGIAVATTIDLNSGTIKDSANNNAGLTFTAPTLTAVLVDTSAPTLSSVTLASNNTATTRAKTGDTVTLTFAASEKISSPTVIIAGHSVSATNSSGNTWSASHTLTGSDTEGAVAFSIAFADIAANAGTTVTATTDSSSVTFDHTVPTLGTVAIGSSNALTARAKAGDTVTLVLSASEVIATPTITIGGHSAIVTSNGLITPLGSGYNATIVTTGNDTEGLLTISIAFADLAGNVGTTVTATTDSSSVTLDHTAPTLSTVTLASSNATPSVAKSGDTVTLTFTASETIATPTVSIAGHTVTASLSSGTTWSAAYALTGSDTEGAVAFSVGFADITGNSGTTVTATTDNSSVTFDRTAPVITSAGSAPGTYKSAYSHTVTASGGAVLYGASGLPAGLTINSATGAITGSPTVNGLSTATVTATDLAGNVGSANLTIDLAKATLTVTGITASNRVYDAGLTATLNTSAAQLVGVVLGDTVQLDSTAAAGAFLTKEIGIGKEVRISGLTITGASSANYALTQPTTTANITAKEISVSGITAGNKIYDGNRNATLNTSGATPVGIVGADNVQLVAASATGTFADASAGSGKTVQVAGLSLTGTDAGNYTVTQPTTTATISPASVSFTFANLNHTYDGTSKGATVTASPSVPFSVTYSVAVNGGGPVNAGTYVVMANVTDANYTGSAIASLVIAKASQTISLSATGGAVGSSVPVSATSSSGLPVSLSIASGGATISGSSLTFTVAGPVVLVATQAGNENYAAATAELTLEALGKRDQTISFGELPARSAGDPAFALTATASSGLPVSYTVSGPAMLDGNQLSITGAYGVVAVTASQAGDATWNAASSVTRSFVVTPSFCNIAMGNFLLNGAPTPGSFGFVFNPKNSISQLILQVTGFFSATLSNLQLQPGLPTQFQIIVDMIRRSLPSDSGTPPRAAELRTIMLTLTVTEQGVVGNIAELGITFSAPFQPSGPTSLVSGFYQANNINSSTGSTSTIVGNNGQVITISTVGSQVIAGTSTLGANGSFTVVDGSATLTGAVDAPSATVSGTITIPGQPTVNFMGVASGVTRTDRMINLSSRVRVAPSGDRTLITGFVIGGSTAKRVLLRAVGPALAGFGLGDALANPRLELYNSTGQLIQQNDDWSGSDTAAAFAQVGAFTLPAGSRDAAMLATLAPGAYTMQVRTSSETGVALAEIYDASINPQGEYQRLVNISSRGTVEAGDGVLVGGFVVTGNSPKKMLIRGVGPALAGFGLTGVLSDPRLTIYNGATIIARNDNWATPTAVTPSQVTADAAEITAAAQAAGAFTFAAGSRDAALIVTLAPGAYTAQVSAADGSGAGVALVEIYEIP